MMLNSRFHEVFRRDPIIGMLHLGGNNPVAQALEDLTTFEEEGVDGAIVENYHGSEISVHNTLKAISKRETTIVIGVNILPNEFEVAFSRAHRHSAQFIQLDYVAGTYRGSFGDDDRTLPVESYRWFREQYPSIIVLGGVWPKYYHPIEGSDLETDLREGMQRAEVIVVTGERTGRRTPIEKIQRFREIMGKAHPLLVGAGSKPEYVAEEARFANGVIIGTAIREGEDTSRKIDRHKVRDYVSAFKEARSSS